MEACNVTFIDLRGIGCRNEGVAISSLTVNGHNYLPKRIWNPAQDLPFYENGQTVFKKMKAHWGYMPTIQNPHLN